VVANECPPELGELLGRIFEYLQHRVAILDRESHQILFRVERHKEHIGGVLESGSEQTLGQERNVPFRNGHAGESHALDATRLIGQTNGSAVAMNRPV
jgi:hypothetical protein